MGVQTRDFTPAQLERFKTLPPDGSARAASAACRRWRRASSFSAARARRAARPNCNHTRQSDCPIQPGLWALEPHVARAATGVKFEEVLVVTDNDAYYLDDGLGLAIGHRGRASRWNFDCAHGRRRV